MLQGDHMDHKDIRSYAVLLAVAVLGNGCGTGMFSGRLDEGVIEYALSFPEYDPNGLMAGMLPERTTMSFDPGRQVTELSAGMGVFRTAIITDHTDKRMDYQLSVLSKKLVAHMQQREVHQLNREQLPLTILHTNEMDTIAGYPCRKAVAVYGAMGKREVELWYTDRIQLADPNWFGPYRDIPGVLLRYELVQHGLRMRLDAISVRPGPVDAAKFSVKEGYESVAPAVLNHELDEVLSTFTM